jgi:hypothetical protein
MTAGRIIPALRNAIGHEKIGYRRNPDATTDVQ